MCVWGGGSGLSSLLGWGGYLLNFFHVARRLQLFSSSICVVSRRRKEYDKFYFWVSSDTCQLEG